MNQLSFDSSKAKAVLIGTGTYVEAQKDNEYSLGKIDNVPTTIQNLENAISQTISDVKTFVDEKDNKRILDCFRNIQNQDLEFILIYYCGHGIESMETEELVLCTSDCTEGNHDDNGVSFFKLVKKLENNSGAIKLIILDCCYSKKVLKTDIADLKDTYIIVSSELKSRRLAFSQALLKTLKNGISNEKRFLTIEDVFNSIPNEIKVDGRIQSKDAIQTSHLVKKTAFIRNNYVSQSGYQRGLITRFDRSDEFGIFENLLNDKKQLKVLFIEGEIEDEHNHFIERIIDKLVEETQNSIFFPRNESRNKSPFRFKRLNINESGNIYTLKRNVSNYFSINSCSESNGHLVLSRKRGKVILSVFEINENHKNLGQLKSFFKWYIKDFWYNSLYENEKSKANREIYVLIKVVKKKRKTNFLQAFIQDFFADTIAEHIEFFFEEIATGVTYDYIKLTPISKHEIENYLTNEVGTYDSTGLSTLPNPMKIRQAHRFLEQII